jgi:hypothetical protein
MATAPASGTQTAIVTINSIDRYASPAIAQDPAQQTTPFDVTYTIPGLNKVSTLQVSAFGAQGGCWTQTSTPGFYTNVINVVYNGVTTLLTLPFDSPINIFTSNILIIQTLLRNTLNDQTIVFYPSYQTTTQNNLNAGGFSTYTTSLQNSILSFLTWTSQNGTLGFSRIGTLNGVDISGKFQLFDQLGLGYQVVSGVPTSAISAIGQFAQALKPFYQGSQSAYYDIVSPDLDPLYPDLSTTANAGQYGTTVIRTLVSFNTSSSTLTAQGTQAGLSLKSFRTKGTNTIRLRWIDQFGNLVPTKLPVPQVYRWVSSSAGSTYVGTAGTGVITVTGTPALTLSGLVAGDKIALFNATQAAICGVWTVTAVGATTISVTCPYVGTVTGCSIGGPYIIGGNTTSYGGCPEYYISFLADYGTNVPVTTT